MVAEPFLDYSAVSFCRFGSGSILVKAPVQFQAACGTDSRLTKEVKMFHEHHVNSSVGIVLGGISTLHGDTTALKLIILCVPIHVSMCWLAVQGFPRTGVTTRFRRNESTHSSLKAIIRTVSYSRLVKQEDGKEIEKGSGNFNEKIQPTVLGGLAPFYKTTRRNAPL